MSDPITSIYLVGLGVAGMVGGYIVNDLRYAKGKKILSAVRKLVDGVDDALYDDKVTEEEFRQGWENLKGVLSTVLPEAPQAVP